MITTAMKSTTPSNKIISPIEQELLRVVKSSKDDANGDDRMLDDDLELVKDAMLRRKAGEGVTTSNLRKAMMAVSNRKPTMSRRKNDALGGTWHGPSSKATKLREQETKPKNSGASRIGIPRPTTTNTRQISNPMAELQLLISGSSPTSTKTTTTTMTTIPRPKKAKDTLGQSWHGAAPLPKVLGKGELRRKAAASLLSTSSHDPRSTSSTHSSRTNSTTDPLRSSRHGGAPRPHVPRRHKSVDDTFLSTEEPNTRENKHDPLRSSQHRHHHRSRSTNKEHHSDESHHKKAHPEKDSNSAVSNGILENKNQHNEEQSTHSRRPHRKDTVGGDAKKDSEALKDRCTRTADKLRDRSSSRGRKKTNQGDPTTTNGENEDNHTKSSRSNTNGEQRRVRSSDRSKRRQLKGTKQIDEQGGIELKEDELTQKEQDEMVTMNFSTMSFENEWDARPTSVRPSLDTARALEEAKREQAEKEKSKQRRKLKSNAESTDETK